MEEILMMLFLVPYKLFIGRTCLTKINNMFKNENVKSEGLRLHSKVLDLGIHGIRFWINILSFLNNKAEWPYNEAKLWLLESTWSRWCLRRLNPPRCQSEGAQHRLPQAVCGPHFVTRAPFPPTDASQCKHINSKTPTKAFDKDTEVHELTPIKLVYHFM